MVHSILFRYSKEEVGIKECALAWFKSFLRDLSRTVAGGQLSSVLDILPMMFEPLGQIAHSLGVS